MTSKKIVLIPIIGLLLLFLISMFGFIPGANSSSNILQDQNTIVVEAIVKSPLANVTLVDFPADRNEFPGIANTFSSRFQLDLNRVNQYRLNIFVGGSTATTVRGLLQHSDNNTTFYDSNIGNQPLCCVLLAGGTGMKTSDWIDINQDAAKPGTTFRIQFYGGNGSNDLPIRNMDVQFKVPVSGGNGSGNLAETDANNLYVRLNPTATQTIRNTNGEQLIIQQDGNVGNSTSVGGALLLDNTDNNGAGLIIYSNMNAGANGRLLNIRADNNGFDQAVVHIDNDGTANALEVVQSGQDSTAQAFNVVSTNYQDSAFTVTSNATGKGVAKIVHDGNSLTPNASGISIDLQGNGTAAQGLYVDSTATSGTTGDLLRLRNRSTDQFVIDKNGNANSIGDINGLRLCINNDCRTAWPNGDLNESDANGLYIQKNPLAAQTINSFPLNMPFNSKFFDVNTELSIKERLTASAQYYPYLVASDGMSAGVGVQDTLLITGDIGATQILMFGDENLSRILEFDYDIATGQLTEISTGSHTDPAIILSDDLRVNSDVNINNNSTTIPGLTVNNTSATANIQSWMNAGLEELSVCNVFGFVGFCSHPTNNPVAFFGFANLSGYFALSGTGLASALNDDVSWEFQAPLTKVTGALFQADNNANVKDLNVSNNAYIQKATIKTDLNVTRDERINRNLYVDVNIFADVYDQNRISEWALDTCYTNGGKRDMHVYGSIDAHVEKTLDQAIVSMQTGPNCSTLTTVQIAGTKTYVSALSEAENRNVPFSFLVSDGNAFQLTSAVSGLGTVTLDYIRSYYP